MYSIFYYIDNNTPMYLFEIGANGWLWNELKSNALKFEQEIAEAIVNCCNKQNKEDCFLFCQLNNT